MTNKDTILFENEFAIYVTIDDPILIDSCVIIPKTHKETPFDLSVEEWNAIKNVLVKVKLYLDKNVTLMDST